MFSDEAPRRCRCALLQSKDTQECGEQTSPPVVIEVVIV
jgi:hypothetical protein